MKRGFSRSTGTTASACLLCCLLLGVSGVWAGDGVVALQTAGTSCADGSGNRYVDCGNGTVTDNETGLVWLANADCLGSVDWLTASEFVAGLSDKPEGSIAAAHDCGLSDGSSPGEWRLPSMEEWEAMVAEAESNNDTIGQQEAAHARGVLDIVKSIGSESPHVGGIRFRAVVKRIELLSPDLAGSDSDAQSD